jgi:serine/threonine protein kinase
MVGVFMLVSTEMESLVQAIRQLQSGALGRPEFFAKLDRMLESTPDSSGRLLEILSEEHARAPLLGALYTEVQQHIERLVAARQRMGGNGGAPATTVTEERPPTHGEDQPFGPVPERMKGVGDTLNGRFVLEQCIGFGGMGTVYKALDLRKLEASDRKPYIAIKVLNVQFRGHPKSLIALQREARKAQALAHPNIVSVYDFDRDGSMVYLTMELLTGNPLSQVLRAPGFAGLPYAEVMRIVTGTGNALAYAHGRGFVHCDFKPGNVFLTKSGDVKVIDFGIARVFQKTEEDADATVFDPGSLGALTPAYASPEMLERREPDPRDDIYALACITYELLTGRHPFNRMSALEARSAGMQPQRPPGLSRKQWLGLKSALAFERAARTPTVGRFLSQMAEGRTDSRFAMPAAVGGAVALLALLAALGLRDRWTTPAPRVEPQAAPAPPAVADQRSSPAAAPEEPAPTADAIAAALARVPCSALVGTMRGHTLEVHGFLSTKVGVTGLAETLGAMPGVVTVKLGVAPVDPDKCAVVSVFAPYWAAHRRAGGGAAIRLARTKSGAAAGAGAVLSEGESLMVDVTTPAAQSFIAVDYYALDGSVVHLLPNPQAPDNQAPPSYTATVGSLGEWAIGKPFGVELLVLLTTPVPLFDTMRPVSEPRADYLAATAKQLEQMVARHGTGKVGVDFLQITTKARRR